MAKMDRYLRKLRKRMERYAMRGKWDGTPEHLDRIMWSVPEIADTLGGKKKRLPGYLAFDMYSTHGWPLDMTVAVMEERGWTVDEREFERLMKRDGELSRDASKFTKQILGEE